MAITLLPELEAVRGALPPCREAVRLRFLPFAVGFVVGPELERAQVVRYRASANLHRSLRLPAPCGATDGFLLVCGYGSKSPLTALRP
jgi:hypothetical protein